MSLSAVEQAVFDNSISLLSTTADSSGLNTRRRRFLTDTLGRAPARRRADFNLLMWFLNGFLKSSCCGSESVRFLPVRSLSETAHPGDSSESFVFS